LTETTSLTSGQEMLITFLAHVIVFCSTLRQYLHVPSCGQLVHKRLPHHPDPTKTITSSLSLPSAKCAVRSKAQGRLKQQVQVAARSPHLDSAKKLVDDDVCGKHPVRPNAPSGEFALILLPYSAGKALCLCECPNDMLCHAQSSRGRQDVLPVGRALEHRTHLQHAAHRR